MGNSAKIHKKLDNQNYNTTTKSNYALFADDAVIDINNIKQTKPLLDTYDESSNEYPL